MQLAEVTTGGSLSRNYTPTPPVCGWAQKGKGRSRHGGGKTPAFFALSIGSCTKSYAPRAVASMPVFGARCGCALLRTGPRADGMFTSTGCSRPLSQQTDRGVAYDRASFFTFFA
jgi:hypothetical protein